VVRTGTLCLSGPEGHVSIGMYAIKLLQPAGWFLLKPTLSRPYTTPWLYLAGLAYPIAIGCCRAHNTALSDPKHDVKCVGYHF